MYKYVQEISPEFYLKYMNYKGFCFCDGASGKDLDFLRGIKMHVQGLKTMQMIAQMDE